MSTIKDNGCVERMNETEVDKENVKQPYSAFETSPKRKKGLEFDWSQSNDSIDMVFKLDTLQMDVQEASKIDVTFSNNDVNVHFPDGNKWYCNFRHEVDAPKCKVFVKKHKIVLHVKKKDTELWSELQASPTPSRSTSGIHLDDLESLDTHSSMPASSVLSGSSGVTAGRDPLHPLSGDTSIDLSSVPVLDDQSLPVADTVDISTECQTAETKKGCMPEDESDRNERVYELDHLKHDFIEKDDVITIHMYVKDIRKDSLRVEYAEKLLKVEFQTTSEKFLKMYDDSTGDTTFSWKIHLANEIVPEKCRFRLTVSLIEVCLTKSVAKRWGILEATRRKGMSNSDTWIPIGHSTASSLSDTSLNTSSSSAPQITISPPDTSTKGKLVFDDLADVNVRRDEDNRTASEMGAVGTRKDINMSQKPMCKVSPMNKNAMEQYVTMGYTGLDNLGNTCFMNSVLQCLSNTREFRDYFLSREFQDDINQDNPLGMGGKLAVSFAVLLKVLWSAKHHSYAPSKLKNLISQKASQFTGFAQHDAQEFMAFLLDGLHEDVNRIRKKPYTETVDSDGRPDEEVADEAWEVYKKRNDSFIVDLLQGQYKSKLTCPICGKISITFDPFLYLSLPLPKKKRYLPVLFFWKDPYRKPVQLGLRLPKDCTTEMVKEEAYKKTGVKPKAMRIFEAYRGRIYKFYGKGTDFSGVQPNDVIIISEVLTEDIAGEPVYELYVIQRTLMPNQPPSRCSSCRRPVQDGYKLKRCTKCYKVGYCDHNCQRTHWSLHKLHCKATPDPVGHPFILSIPESRATFSRLCTMMEAYSRYSVDVFQPPVRSDAKHQRPNQSSPSSEMSSNSSQSSGSISSLDSQSSCSSSCTITGDQILADEVPSVTDSSGVEPGTSSSSLLTQTSGSNTDFDPSPIGHDPSVTSSELDSGMESGAPGVSPSDTDLTTEGDDNLSGGGSRNLPEYSSFKMPTALSNDGGQRGETDESSGDNSSNSSDAEKSNGQGVPTKCVMGIQSGDTDRQVPLFYIKPVNQEGMGVKGPTGARLDDLGDTPLDLSTKQYLSMDWKNNEKFDQYVLVQSKDLEYEEDDSFSSNVDETANITINQCLDLFTEPEVLSPEEAWYCPRCKEHREATKQMTIWRLPHTLIIQLKRFSFRNFIWRDKIDKMVDFPIRGLDLTPYCLGASHISDSLPIYDLYAVVNHYGGILGGHYTSFVRCADLYDPLKNDVDWRLCDDSRVTSMSNERNVVTKGAYLLFYRRREPFKLEHPISYTEEEDENNSQMNNTGDVSEDEGIEEKETTYEKVSRAMEEDYARRRHSDDYDSVTDGYRSDSEFTGFTKFDAYRDPDKGATLIFDSTKVSSSHNNDVQEVPTRDIKPASTFGYTDMEDVD
ncbi:hypothetical protein FSP39_025069 [Pinctada imbricata]|uniref:ubiquitinyl hydrolase 1 n=1 Tax=Pinctada imbricata TaxID=66713 RepID=A0AA89CBQ1_PINIB|nr:hypothetical protein FSP39_025069 [Pinctada imbricata]